MDTTPSVTDLRTRALQLALDLHRGQAVRAVQIVSSAEEFYAFMLDKQLSTV